MALARQAAQAAARAAERQKLIDEHNDSVFRIRRAVAGLIDRVNRLHERIARAAADGDAGAHYALRGEQHQLQLKLDETQRYLQELLLRGPFGRS